MKTQTILAGDLIQISFDRGATWLDYARVSAHDIGFAKGLVHRGEHTVNLEGKMGRYRIVRKEMGTKVILAK